ncbi:hypothetical protein [Nocardia sp. NPDC050793]|uniref:hypothetical protein n=1 Tax=Nocardia sp. NPDC050793 TaxID=3155159 RepID=UPI00340CF7B0
MATEKSVIPFHSFSLRTATLVVGALSAAVVTAAPAVADAPPPGASAPAGVVTDPLLLGANVFGAPIQLPIPLPVVPAIAPAPVADPAEPAPEAEAEVAPDADAPDADAPAADVPAPDAPAPDVVRTPTNVIRIGSIEVGRPDFIAPEVAGMINDATMGAQNGLSGAIQGAGVDRTRSDLVAANVIGGTTLGAAAGAAVASPIAAVAAVIGGAVGLVVAIPFAPAGFIFMPIIAGSLAVGMVALPFAAVGAGIGAIVGAVAGSVAPLPAAPPVAPPPGEVPAA